MSITLQIPRPHEAQQLIIDESKRFNVVACGRRFGKTKLGINRIVTPKNLAGKVGWFAPSYKTLYQAWVEVVEALRPITKRKNEQLKRIELVTGGLVEFWSLDKPDIARGRDYDCIIVDEAAMVKNLIDAWNNVLRPTLADRIGGAWLLSTPKGKNGYYTMFNWGQDGGRDNWGSWSMSTHKNPYIDNSEIELMGQEMPERVYNQEILAVFTDNESTVFRNISANLTPCELHPSGFWWDGEDHTGETIVAGVDWARSVDYTAVSIGSVEAQKEIALFRVNTIDFVYQRQRLMELGERFGVDRWLVESNSIGEPNLQELTHAGLPVEGFATTAQSKPPLIENLVLSLEKEEFQFLDVPIATAELGAYEVKISPTTNRATYSAPSGQHDDTVVARALMRRAAQSTSFFW